MRIHKVDVLCLLGIGRDMTQETGKKRRVAQKDAFSSAIGEQLLRERFLSVSYKMKQPTVV